MDAEKTTGKFVKQEVKNAGQGIYSHLPDSKYMWPGKDFTKKQKRLILEENKKMNNGKILSDKSKQPLNYPKQDKKVSLLIWNQLK